MGTVARTRSGCVAEAHLEAVGTDAATFKQCLNSHPRIDVARPMLRLYLAPERQSSRWQVLLHCHHLILDHSSLESLLAELQAHLQGRTEPLPSLLPFRDFVSAARAAQETRTMRRSSATCSPMSKNPQSPSV